MQKNQSIVWKQFKNRKIGYYSFIVVIIMFGISIYAPFIANNQPFYLYSKFPTLYNSYFLSAEKNLEVLLSASGREEELKEMEKFYIQGFNRQRELIGELNSRLVDAGNEYDAVIAKIYAVEGQIERSRRRGISDIDSLLQEKERLEHERNVIGGIRNQIQSEIVEQTNIQNYKYNQPLLEVRFLLATGSTMTNLRNALSGLSVYVDRGTRQKIETIIDKIKGISYYDLDPDVLNEAFVLLQKLSLQNIEGNLIYKGIFPVLSSLSYIDIFLMVIYIVLVMVLLIGPHYIFQARIIGTAILSTIIFSYLLFLVFPNYPGQDYKLLLSENINSGWTDSYAIFPVVPYGMNENNFYESFQKPSFFSTDGMKSRHILGTDDNGRSIISRMIWGSRVSLSVGFVSVSIYVVLGIIIGSIAGYYGKWVDILISRLIEVMMCFPSFFLILAVIAFVGPSIYNIMLVIGFTAWTGIARLIRGEFLRIKSLDYVQAGKALGASAPRSIALHILPNALTPVLVSAAFGFAGAVLTEAGLSFLGFGVQDPMASWGQMLSASRGHPLLYWWMFIIPGFALFVTVTLYNLIGNTLRDAIDPRLRM